jgi:hypothetical protein
MTMKTITCAVLMAFASLTACSSKDDSSASTDSGRKGGAAPSAATVVVSKGNAFGSYVDDVNKAKALQRQSVDQSHPDLDKQMDAAPASATANGP